jgi:hypothetical protein
MVLPWSAAWHARRGVAPRILAGPAWPPEGFCPRRTAAAVIPQTVIAAVCAIPAPPQRLERIEAVERRLGSADTAPTGRRSWGETVAERRVPRALQRGLIWSRSRWTGSLLGGNRAVGDQPALDQQF